MYNFIWLDLRGSVQWANKLGDWAYAQQIEACWQQLEVFLRGSEVLVYQYVGDAVILYADKVAVADMVEIAEKLQNWASQTYNFVFRAAVHRGAVVHIVRGGQQFFYGKTMNELFELSNTQKQLSAQNLVYSPQARDEKKEAEK
jgi:class 3 adenylate cyclase